MRERFEDWWDFNGDVIIKSTIVFFLIVLTIFGVLILGGSLSESYSETLWNGGICAECEKGHYEYFEAVGHRSYTSYIYNCDNCNHKIEINELK